MSSREVSCRDIARNASVHKIHLRRDRDDAALVSHIEQLADGLPAVGAVVQGALVHIHAHKAAGHSGVKIAGKLHGIFERLFAVVERMPDAVAQSLGDDLVLFRAQRAADGVAAQRQHQAGGLLPPDAEIENLVEAAGGIGELALVDDEAGVVVSRQHRRNDLIEGHGLGLDIGIEDLQRQISGGQRAGNGNFDALQVLQRQRLGWRRSWGRSPRRRCRRSPSACSSPARKGRRES